MDGKGARNLCKTTDKLTQRTKEKTMKDLKVVWCLRNLDSTILYLHLSDQMSGDTDCNLPWWWSKRGSWLHFHQDCQMSCPVWFASPCGSLCKLSPGCGLFLTPLMAPLKLPVCELLKWMPILDFLIDYLVKSSCWECGRCSRWDFFSC